LSGDGQQSVSCGVSEGVVDVLEVSEVEEQDGSCCPAFHGDFDCLVERVSVRESGQRVMQCVVSALVREPSQAVDDVGLVEGHRDSVARSVFSSLPPDVDAR